MNVTPKTHTLNSDISTILDEFDHGVLTPEQVREQVDGALNRAKERLHEEHDVDTFEVFGRDLASP